MLRKEEDVRKTLEEIRRKLRKGETTTIEVSEEILEFAVDEAIKQKLSVIGAYEENDSIVVVLEKRHQ